MTTVAKKVRHMFQSVRVGYCINNVFISKSIRKYIQKTIRNNMILHENIVNNYLRGYL